MHQQFFANSPGLDRDGPRNTSATITVPVPPQAKSFRVGLGLVQLAQGVPTAIAPSSGPAPVADPLAAFGALPLGVLEDAAGDLGTLQIQLQKNVFVPINVPNATRSLSVTVVWGLLGPSSLPPNALKVPVFVDFE